MTKPNDDDDDDYVGTMRLKSEAQMRKARADARTEAPVETHFRKVAKLYGCLQRKLTQFYAEDGWPDRLCVWPDGRGTCDWVELKRPSGGRLEPRQKVIIPELRSRGATVEIINTKELVDRWFRVRAVALGVPVPAKVMNRARISFTVCGVCGEAMFKTPSGMVCENGHGGAELL